MKTINKHIYWIASAILIFFLFLTVAINSHRSLSHQSDKEISLPDPNRPYYDGSGNKFDYQGNKINDVPQVQYKEFEGK